MHESESEKDEGRKTCINKTIMEMKTEQGRAHAMLFGYCTEDCISDDRDGSGTCCFIAI